MRRREKKRLRLSTETIRDLSQPGLKRVGGGIFNQNPSDTDCSYCETCTTGLNTSKACPTLNNCPTANCAPWSHTCVTWYC